ncbi:transketolase [Trueperella pyogenes]|uniref:Transketolase n=1 Tax=Trueperella pyogenes TaxID=1661 RepID=A0A3S9QJB4_9ACTO|nr:transketolase [Trueperella pyogenes]AJC69584.1 transketolase [Trueperella pyogenes TP8]ALD74242.1 transketolase [Trueperella pyogenes]AWG04641.1 transketolase [Trueperella pyogenes]AWG15468.1 transketolase [Trueperella pyogenes]AZR04355.1 transketolase [Trueperella pyogenes]
MTTFEWSDLDQKAVDTGRALAADAVQKVGNGHPGTAMSLSPAAYLLFQKVMRNDPSDDSWLGRDRFVMSAGHSSLTQYIQLFLSGYGLDMDDLKALRTEGSRTPGHPEYGHTKGIEITTGPLGQGLASAVGMAMASRRAHGLFDPNTPAGESVFDHFVYVIAGDGCMQEGVTSEASSLAGTQKLGNLVVIYDDNRISIEDDTSIAFSEDVLARYEAYGWHTQHVDWLNGGDYREDVEALFDAIEAAKKVTDKPSIIRLSTIIAWPSPTKKGTGASHGSALGDDEIRQTKEILGLDPDESFFIEPEVLEHTRAQAKAKAEADRSQWQAKFDQWAATNPEAKKLFDRVRAHDLPEGFAEAFPTFEAGKAVATRAASGVVLNAIKDVVPELWGGSADLAGSNNTYMKGEPSFFPEERSSKMFPGNEFGRNLHFGVREHSMGSIVNGIALDGLTRPYGGTFFVFADYMRPAVRLAALMKTPSVFVWTHDSVGVGEDGPTHQPVEHLWAYRAIPGLDIVRPADANETSYAWRGILERTDRPAGLILSRQNLPVPARGEGELASAEGVLKGGYVLADSEAVDVVLIATGSEVAVALEAREELAKDGIGARVVSMPCLEWFAEQSEEYRESVIPSAVKARVSVEAGSTLGWRNLVGDAGRMVGIDHFGESASGSLLLEKYGMTAANVAAAAKESIEAAKK